MVSINYTKYKGKQGLTYGFQIKDNQGIRLLSKSGFKTKKIAKATGEKIRLELDSGSKLNLSSTVHDIWQVWYDLEIKPSSLSERTKYKYRSHGRVIDKLFNGQKVSKIKPSEYQKIMNDYGKDVGKDSLKRLDNEIKKVVAFAIRDKLYMDDFTVGYKRNAGKQPKKAEDKYIESIEDYKKILDYLANHLDYKISVIPYFYYLMFKTGLRLSETLAVNWEDINFDKMVLYTYRRYSLADKKYVPPKTPESIRYVQLDDETIKAFRALKKSRIALNEDVEDKEMVFLEPDNQILSHYKINRAIQKYLSDLNITPIITPYGTRHTYISVLLAQGVDIEVIVKQVGHKNSTQIRETYGHILRETLDAGNDKIKKIMGSFGKNLAKI